MAEPARAYDPDDEEPVVKPNLRALQEGEQEAAVHEKANKPVVGTGKKAGTSGKALKRAEESWGTAGVVSGEGGKEDSSDKLDKLSDKLGAGFNPNDKAGKDKLKLLFSLNAAQKKKALLGGGIIGGLIAIIVGLFLVLIPLKIESIVDNLEDHFFASSENATEGETENLFSGYIKNVISDFPGHNCTSTRVDKDCAPTFNGNNPVQRLYRTWQQARLETKLADDYGLEFRWDKTSNTYYVKVGGESDAKAEADSPISKAELGDAGSDLFDDGEWSETTRNGIRMLFRDSIKDETLLNRVWLHFKFGRLMEEKYGIKRCIVFCQGRDQLSDAIEAGKNSAKIIFTRRVITPRAQALGQAIECVLDTSCDPGQTQSSTADDVGDAELDGEPESVVETTIRQQLQTLFAQFGSEDPEVMISLYNSITEAGGVQQYLIQQVFSTLFGEEGSQVTAETIGKAIPVVGWINLAFQIVHLADTAGPKVKKLSYIIDAGSAVATYMTYRSYADEVKTGQANATEVGQFNDSLGPTTKPDSDGEGGGTASAEQTPLYQNLIDGNQPLSSTTSSLLNDVLPSQAYAANPTPAASPSYTCQDGSTPLSAADPGIVCNEEILGQGNAVLNSLHSVLNYPGLSLITEIANVWQGTIGHLFNLLGSLISLIASPIISTLNDSCSLPFNPFQPYCDIRSAATAAGEFIMKWLTDALIPNPFGSNMSGGRTFDEMAAGADVSGNDYAHTSLGGQAVSNQQVLTMYNQQQAEDQYAFEQEPFFSRIFDTGSQFSLISKMATAMPSNIGSSVQSTLSGFLEDPLSGLAHGVASLFAIGRVNAAAPIYACPGDSSSTSQYDDFFCVTQYGYPSSQIPSDPNTYWNQYCADNPNVLAGQATTNWNNAAQNAGSGGAGTDTAFVDPNTGMSVNTTTDPCLLIQAATGAAGALFNPSLLTSDDLADTSQTTTLSSSGQNIVAQAVEPTSSQSTNFFAIVFHHLDALGRTIDQQFRESSVIWTGQWFDDL